jgi:hypothetical protein
MKIKLHLLLGVLLFSVFMPAHAQVPSLIGVYEGEIRGTTISMLIEATEKVGLVVMRQRLERDKQIFSAAKDSQQAVVMEEALLSKIFASGVTFQNAACFHPLPPSQPLPFICRVPKNLAFKFSGPYGWASEFTSSTGVIYVMPFVDHLRPTDLNFSQKEQ